MKSRVPDTIKALAVAVLGIGIAALGIYLGETDDAPGAALAGIVLMIGSMVLAVKIARRQNRA